MEKYFAPYEPSLALKELGFDEPCFAYYNGRFLDFKIWNDDGCEASQINVNMNVGQCPNAPTFSQAFEWFRKNYSLYQEIRTFAWDYDKNQLGFSVGTYLNPFQTETEKKIHLEVYETYEEAELACLLKLIEIVKSK